MRESPEMMLEVDVVLLTRPCVQPDPRVIRAIESQQGVQVRLHRHVGHPSPADRNRWETIARARNGMKTRGVSPWVLFVDEDVVLGDHGIALLWRELVRDPGLGAVAADYNGERLDPRWEGHVGLGACLFRRHTLERVRFRATDTACECRCCAADLRDIGIGIRYSTVVKALHLRRDAGDGDRPHPAGEPCILAAFDRRDVRRFERQFLHSLRAWGNRERVIAVTYGLYPTEAERVRRLADVEVVRLPASGVMVPIRRLRDFADVTGRLPAGTPVAYWDVADVIFQTSLAALWQEVARHPQALLAVREPKGYPENQVIEPWTQSIRDPMHRARAWRLVTTCPFLNSGFAAGTAAVMRRYFSTAWRMRVGPELSGTTDWGDQMGLNLYCHADPGRWHAVHEGWNYCVHDRPDGEVHVGGDGIIRSRRLGVVPVAHGNARSLRQFALDVSS